MKPFVIYEDQNLKVEIDGQVHQFLKECSTPYFVITPEQHRLILGHVATSILEARPELALSNIISKNMVFDLSGDKPLYFDEPFDYFNEAARIILQQEDFDNSLIEVSEKIKKAYEKADNFLFQIYPFALFNVRGYFTFFEEDTIYVLLFYA